MAQLEFDLVVIGTGTAGLTVANKCQEKGLSVAIIDTKPFGGTCALRGCDPKKVLVGLAEAVDQVNRFYGKGLEGSVKINWKEMMAFKETFTSEVPANRERSLKAKEIATFHGMASFTGKNSINIGSNDLKSKFIVIATGAKPMQLPFEGSEFLLDNEQFLNLKHLPKRVLFVGGGFVSMEFAHIAARAGAEVTVVNDGDHILTNFDPFLVSLLEERTKEIGIQLINQSRVSGILKRDDAYEVKVSRSGSENSYTVDLVVHGAGRVPNIDDLNLSAANVKSSRGGIEVNNFGQSVSNPAVYAAGDVAKGGLPLTPVASFEAHIVASNILKGNNKETSYPPIPSVAFTIPHIASVGLTEEEAKAKGIKYQVNKAHTSDWFTSKRLAEKYEGYKILISEDGSKILGAHLMGHKADEVINLFTLAIHKGLGPVDIKKMIFAYPTSGSDISYMV